MTMKRAAALGLSTLMLGGNLLMPAASLAMSPEPAGTVAVNQPTGETMTVTTETRPMAGIAGEWIAPNVQKKKPGAFRRLLKALNPWNWLPNRGAETATSIPVAPLEPAVDINPAMTENAAPTETAPEAAPEQEAPAVTYTYRQILPAKPSKAKAPAVKTGNLAMKAPEPTEVFNFLGMQPPSGNQLAAAYDPFSFMPTLDSPDVSPVGGDATLLRAGLSQKQTAVDLTIGKAQVINLSRPASRVSISNPEIASAVVISPTQIQLIGRAVGVANLLIWSDNDSQSHTVVDISVHRDVSVLSNQLKYVDAGIRIVPLAAEDTVILTGEAENRETAQLAIEMAQAFFNRSAGASNAEAPNSQAPGSALPGTATNVINLIKIKGEPSTKLELVRSRLAEIDPNIKVDVVPGPDGTEKVILTGRVQTASLAAKALNLASVFYGQPGTRMVTAQGGYDPTRMTVNDSSVTVTQGNNVVANILHGSIMTDATGNVISMLEVAQKPQVRCSIKFLELSRNGLRAFGSTLSGVHGSSKFTNYSGTQSPAPGRGVSTPSAQNPPGAGWSSSASRGNGSGWDPISQLWNQNFNEVYGSGITQVFSINNQIATAVQALEEKRLARTLAEPTITLMSGEQGSFLAGGEVPIAFLGGQGQISVEFHEYGIRLNLLPMVTDDGKIQMQIAPEVSTIDNSVNVQGVPGFTTRRMQSTLLVENGQAFVLAGLFSREDSESVSQFPGIGSLPIIGSFFKNKWKDRTESELVVIVKPEIIMSHTGPTQPQLSTQPPATELKSTEISRQAPEN